MAGRLGILTLMAAMVTLPAAVPAWAQEIVFQNLGAGLGRTETVRQQRFRQDRGSLPVAGGRLAESRWPPGDVPAAPQNRGVALRPGDQRCWPAGAARAASWERPIRLPGVEPAPPVREPPVEAGPAPARPVDDTGSEHHRYHINPSRGSFAGTASNSGRTGDDPRLEAAGRRIGLPGGQLGGTALTSSGGPGGSSWAENDLRPIDIRRGPQRQTVGTPPVRGGMVDGRLLNKGRPLANCRVVLVPLQKKRSSYSVDGSKQPLCASTDDRGVYYFENVPAGAYKLTWLPSGTRQWIRRIRWKPDVVVHHQEVVSVKDIRTALRTIN